jgi:hypothetical protein
MYQKGDVDLRNQFYLSTPMNKVEHASIILESRYWKESTTIFNVFNVAKN